MLQQRLSNLAGPLALAAGASIIVAQLLWLPFDPDDHVATATDPVFQTGNVVYLVGFCALMLALIATYERQAAEAGRLGLIGAVVAIVGTMLLGGDLWFETFAISWIADDAPALLEADDPSTLLAIGAVSSYLLFALGWILFGIASFRAHVFPSAICIALVVGGFLGFRALLAPFGIPLGLAVAWLGVWMMTRDPRAEDVPAGSAEPRASPHSAASFVPPESRPT
jgi:hypothetical protein